MLVDESVEREPEEASEEPNEIERILDELADGIPEPTLIRLSEEDVALDMDEVVVDVIDEEDSDSSDGDLRGKRRVAVELCCCCSCTGYESLKFH